MARIVEDDGKPWTAVIRCAHPVCAYFGGLHRVDGCFSLIEITLDDIQSSMDSEGDWSIWVICPKCGQRLYPEWQLGNGPIEIVKERHRAKRKKNG